MEGDISRNQLLLAISTERILSKIRKYHCLRIIQTIFPRWNKTVFIIMHVSWQPPLRFLSKILSTALIQFISSAFSSWFANSSADLSVLLTCLPFKFSFASSQSPVSVNVAMADDRLREFDQIVLRAAMIRLGWWPAKWIRDWNAVSKVEREGVACQEQDAFVVLKHAEGD